MYGCMHAVGFYTNGLSIVSTVFNCHFSKQQQAVMTTDKYHCYNTLLRGLIVWWTGRWLPANQLTGTVPTELGAMTRLTQL
jgi:hypothetical protein